MKTYLNFKTLFVVNGIFLFLLTMSNCNLQTEATNNETKSSNKQIEGVFQYLPPLQGQAIMIDNYFSFVGGSSDSTMITEAGTYVESNDTIYNKVLYSSNPKLIGYEFKCFLPSLHSERTPRSDTKHRPG